MPERIPCTIIEDLLPLYLEGETQEETKKIIEEHLAECKNCERIYRDMSGNTFQDIDINDEDIAREYASETKYLLKAKRVLLAISIAAAFIFVTFTGSSYLLGKTQGEYSERFKLAEEHDFFLNVDDTKVYNGNSITLTKILLDSSMTSIILESDLDLDYFDSIILKDDEEQYYRRAFSLFERQYYKNGNIYIFDFEPVRPEADSLIMELTKFYDDDTFTSVTFEVKLDNRNKITEAEGYRKKYSDLLQAETAGIGISLDSLVQGAGYTVLDFKLDFTGTIFDNVNFGWYTAQGLEDVNVLDLKADDGDPLEVLTIDDITMEQLIPEDGITPPPRPTYTIYRMVTTPLPDSSTRLQLELDNLYALKYLNNKDIQLDFLNNDSIELDKIFSSDYFTVKLKSVIREKDKIKLYYEIRDSNNQLLPDHLLDARIRITDNIYDVPVQGRNKVEGNETYLEFENLDANKYTLNLYRLGFELKNGIHVIETSG